MWLNIQQDLQNTLTPFHYLLSHFTTYICYMWFLLLSMPFPSSPPAHPPIKTYRKLYTSNKTQLNVNPSTAGLPPGKNSLLWPSSQDTVHNTIMALTVQLPPSTRLKVPNTQRPRLKKLRMPYLGCKHVVGAP